MRFKKIDNDKTSGTRISGISLDGLNAIERQDCFSEWAETYCDYYPTAAEALSNLPFAVKLPDTSVIGPVQGVYVFKKALNSAEVVMVHYKHGINGVTLTISPNLTKLEAHYIKQVGNNPMALGWSDGELYYIICDGWEECHTEKELKEVLLSLKY